MLPCLIPTRSSATVNSSNQNQLPEERVFSLISVFPKTQFTYYMTARKSAHTQHGHLPLHFQFILHCNVRLKVGLHAREFLPPTRLRDRCPGGAGLFCLPPPACAHAHAFRKFNQLPLQITCPSYLQPSTPGRFSHPRNIFHAMESLFQNLHSNNNNSHQNNCHPL